METWEEAQEEDGHPGGGLQTETKEAMKEGGDRRDPEQEEHSRTQATAITVAHGGAEGMKEPDGAGGMKGRGAAREVESRGTGWSMPDQGGARGS